MKEKKKKMNQMKESFYEYTIVIPKEQDDMIVELTEAANYLAKETDGKPYTEDDIIDMIITSYFINKTLPETVELLKIRKEQGSNE